MREREREGGRRGKQNRREEEKAHGSSQVTVFSVISNFWQDWITGFSMRAHKEQRSLLFNRSWN